MDISLEKKDKKYIVHLPNNQHIELIYCPPGSFMMGTPKGRLTSFKDETEHKVIITRNFYLGKYPVTQGQFRSVLDGVDVYWKYKNDDFPASVYTTHMYEFCRILNDHTKGIRPKIFHFGLPTEAQWEYACRAGTTTDLYNGKNITSFRDSCSNLDEIAWYRNNSGMKLHPVGEKKPNAWGFYDMIGNVWEYVADFYWEDITGLCVDPVPAKSYNMVMRGGSFDNPPWQCRSARRWGHSLTRLCMNIGFRLALKHFRLTIIPAVDNDFKNLGPQP